MNRRHLLLAAPAFLAACGTPVSQVQTYADLITTGVTVFAPVAKTKASPADQAVIDQAVSAIQAADAAIDANKDAAVNAQTIVTWVQKIVPIATALLPAGSTEALAATAAMALLPAILRAVGVVSVGAYLAPVSRRVPEMSEAEAMARLQGLRKAAGR